MVQAVRRSITAESRQLAEVSAGEVGVCIETPDGESPYIQGAYTIVKRWYRGASARKPYPSQADMEMVSRDYAALYQ